MGGRRNWTIEDNVVALYVAHYRDDGLILPKGEIRHLIERTGIPKKAFLMRLSNYRYIVTDGKEGLDAGYKNGYHEYKKLHLLFKSFNKDTFTDYVNMILKTKMNLKEGKKD